MRLYKISQTKQIVDYQINKLGQQQAQIEFKIAIEKLQVLWLEDKLKISDLQRYKRKAEEKVPRTMSICLILLSLLLYSN